jgi:hypothetical protein
VSLHTAPHREPMRTGGVQRGKRTLDRFPDGLSEILYCAVGGAIAGHIQTLRCA